MAPPTPDEDIWSFNPNRIAPIVFAALFTASGCHHVWQAHHYASYTLTLPIPLGALLYTAGLATRSASAFHPSNEGLVIASGVLVLDATAIAAASNYLALGRTLYYIPSCSPLSPTGARQTFIFLDGVIGIFATVGLSHVYEDGRENVRIGMAFVRASLVLQALLYCFYLVVLGVWDGRVRRRFEGRTVLARAYVRALYACGGLVLLRCCVRTAEYFEGARGDLERHEWVFYVFDAVVILAMMWLMNVCHPGKSFPRDSSVYLALDGVTEARGPGRSDGRRWYWVIVDPLGLVQYIRTRGKELKFWELPEVQETVERDGPAFKAAG